MPERVARLEPRRRRAARAGSGAVRLARRRREIAAEVGNLGQLGGDDGPRRVVARVLGAALERHLRRHKVAEPTAARPKSRPSCGVLRRQGGRRLAPSGTPPRPRRRASARSAARTRRGSWLGARQLRRTAFIQRVTSSRRAIESCASVSARVCASSASAASPARDEQLRRARLRPRVVLEASVSARATASTRSSRRRAGERSKRARPTPARGRSIRPPSAPLPRARAPRPRPRPPEERDVRHRPRARREREHRRQSRSLDGGQRAVGRVRARIGACAGVRPPRVERRDGVLGDVGMRGLGERRPPSLAFSRLERRADLVDVRAQIIGGLRARGHEHQRRAMRGRRQRAPATARSQLPAGGRAATISARRWIAATARSRRRPPTGRSAACSRPGGTRPRARGERRARLAPR